MKGADSGSVLFSLQSKLIAAFVLVMLVTAWLFRTSRHWVHQ